MRSRTARFCPKPDETSARLESSASAERLALQVGTVSLATSKLYTRAVLPPAILACSSSGTPARSCAIGELERRFPNLDLGARPPDKPPSHDVGVQGANEDGRPPQRNSASDKPVAQLGQYLLRQRGRPSAVDQPLGNRSDFGVGHRAGIGSLLHRSSYYLVEPVWGAIGDRSDPVSPKARNAAFSDGSHAREGSLARMT